MLHKEKPLADQFSKVSSGACTDNRNGAMPSSVAWTIQLDPGYDLAPNTHGTKKPKLMYFLSYPKQSEEHSILVNLHKK